MNERETQVADLLNEARGLSGAGRLEEAAGKFRQLIALHPTAPSLHFECGVVEYRRGEHRAAIADLQTAVDLDPSQASFHNGLGIALSAAGELAAGARCFEKVIELDPVNAMAHSNLGSNYKNQGRLADAVACYRKAISLNPEYLPAYGNLGELLLRLGQLPEAADAFRRALSIDAELSEYRFRLACTLHHMGQHADAAALFRQLAEREPEYPGLYNNLGLAEMRLGHHAAAVACFHRAIAIEPESAAAYVSLGNTLQARGNLDGALENYRRALEVQPDHSMAHSNLLLVLNYFSGRPQDELYREARQFEAQQVPHVAQRDSFADVVSDANRILRVGYVSADFRSHSVAHFTRKLIGMHARDQVEVFCYANVRNRDAVTKDFESRADHWRWIVGMSDADIEALIRNDGIDILVDLAGHTAHNNLLTFARRAAPIQVTWLGYPNTTGLSAMDYRLTDDIADPPGDADRWYTEQLVRLPRGFLCYQTDDPAPPVSTSPCVGNGYVTFGSFNNVAKVTPDVLRVWSAILTSIPDARLLLKSAALADDETRAGFIAAFEALGVDAERVDFLGLIPGRENHLAAYANIDVALDTFPYNGTTTTCEALWMGVPVVSLRGDRHSGRVGASILQHVGLGEFVTGSEADYVELACSLARDREKLAALRQQLRPTMRDSTLMDTRGFVRSLENAYRDMWKAWCDKRRR